MKRIFLLFLLVLLNYIALTAQSSHVDTTRNTRLELAAQYIDRADFFSPSYYYYPNPMFSMSHDSAIFYLKKAAPLYEEEQAWKKYLNCLLRLAIFYNPLNNEDCSNFYLDLIQEKIKTHRLHFPDIEVQLKLLSINTLSRSANTDTVFEQGEIIWKDALSLCLKEYGAFHPLMINIYYSFALIATGQKEALDYTQKAFDLWKVLLKNKDKSLLQYSIPTPQDIISQKRHLKYRLGMINTRYEKLKVKEIEELQKLQWSFLKLKVLVFGENHPSVAATYYQLSWYRSTPQKSLKYLKKALEIGQLAYKEEHPFNIRLTWQILHYYYNGLTSYNKKEYPKMEAFALNGILNMQEKYAYPYFRYEINHKHEKYLESTKSKLRLTAYKHGLYNYSKPNDLIRVIKKIKILLENSKNSKALDAIIEKAIHIRRRNGNIHFKIKSYKSALKDFKAIFQIVEYTGFHYDIDEITLSNMVECLYQTGDFYAAIEIVEQLLQKAKNKMPETAFYWTQLGNIYQGLGIVDKANINYDKSLKVLSGNFPNENQKNWLGKARICVVYQDFNKAIEYFNKAKEKTLNYSELNLIGLEIGDCYVQLGKFEKAIEVYSNIKNSNCLSRLKHSKLHLKLGDVYFLKNDYETAETYYQKRHPYESENSSIIKIIQGDYIEGLKEYQQKLKEIISSSKYPKDTLLYKNPSHFNDDCDLQKVIDILYLKAKGFYAYYKNETHRSKELKMTVETYSLIDTLFEKQRQKNFYGSIPLDFIQKRRKIYSEAIPCTIEYYQFTKDPAILKLIFRWIDKSKAYLLLNTIQNDKFKSFAGIPLGSIEGEKELKRKISLAQQQLNYSSSNLIQKEINGNDLDDSEDIISLKQDLEKYKKGYENLIRTLEEQYPKYAALKYQKDTTNIADIQQLLKDSTAFLNYFVGEEQIYLLSITSKTTNIQIIEKGEGFEETIKNFIQHVKNPPKSYNLSNHYNHFVKESQYLYQKLLTPALSKLTGIRHLIISPDGVLSTLPFGALIPDTLTIPKSKDVDGVNYKKLPYLQKQYNIQYTYSAAMLFQENVSQQKRKNNIVAFAPFAADSIQVEGSGNIDSLRSSNLGLLPGSLMEIQNIANNSQLKGKYYFGEQASEEQFYRNQKSANIIHLSTHGDVNLKNEDHSKLIFSGSLQGEDDSLFTYEIYNLNLQTDLVVLSACQTGEGKYVKGEGIFSLARAFMYAGSPSVVMTLWKVADRESAALIGHFYKHLEAGQSKSQALQKAKMDYLKDTLKEDDYTLSAHPFYWASFVLIGNNEPLIFEIP